MHSFYDLVIFENLNEHDSEHNLEHALPYSKPKIYDAKGDLSKRWYLYFSYLDPETGKLKRCKNIYGKTNKYHTKEARYSILSTYRRQLLKLLKEGYSPFEDNSQRVNKDKKAIEMAEPTPTIEVENEPTEVKKIETSKKRPDGITKTTHSEKTIKEAFDFALDLKESVVGFSTHRDYKNRAYQFMAWLEEYMPEIDYASQLDKSAINGFLNDLQLNASARNRNNHRTNLSALLQVMEDNDIIAHNYIKNIKPLKSIPKRNKTYSLELQEEIFTHLEEADPILLLFIKFISFNLLRPIEVCRLKVGDLNLKEKTITFKAKNSPLKTKIIPQILLDDLPDLSNIKSDHFLFTPDKIGGPWEATENNRRDYFTKRFLKVVKKPFNLEKNYTMYGFRHTFITKLYKALIKTSTPFAAKSQLMLITGHSTMTALDKYLRSIDAELPEDYSNLLDMD
ncbi:site-specific integrase [Winogradskyella maritima]|uniref:Tyrosine-type recombinase/integrase n=1 Tax=Winogradskyella maritima TaxID=1517766 RepID=A0ABV8AC78_9FLAO|nr:site-specific integrase [Winogradskyella maritima]